MLHVIFAPDSVELVEMTQADRGNISDKATLSSYAIETYGFTSFIYICIMQMKVMLNDWLNKYIRNKTSRFVFR